MDAEEARRVLIHILVTREDGEWVAHALEFDLMAGGDSQEHALGEICDMIEAYFEACAEDGLTLEEAKRPAPKEYFERFDEAFKDPDLEAGFLRQSFEYPSPKSAHRRLALA